MPGHDFATYNPIDHSRTPDLDLLREEGFLWNPWTGHLLCVYNGEATKEYALEDPLMIYRDSSGRLLVCFAWQDARLLGDAVVHGLKAGADGYLVVDDEGTWADAVAFDGWPRGADERIEDIFEQVPAGWVGVAWAGEESCDLSAACAAIAASRTQIADFEREKAKNSRPARDTGDAYTPDRVTLRDLVEAYQRETVAGYKSMLLSHEIDERQYRNACAGLDALLANEFGKDYETLPRPTRPMRGEIGLGLAAVDKPLAAKLDPKGHIVLDSFFARGMERVAMVYLGGDVQPFVVAHGYDPLTGDWSHGSYCSNLDDAVAAMDDENPEIVASVQLMSTMVEDCLEAANRATSAENVDVVVDEVDTKELVQHMVNMAWDYVSNAVDDIRYKLEPAADTPAPATVTWLEHEEGLDAHDAGEVH